MPWDTSSYPSSLKNLEKPIFIKAIEIANAMIDQGYKEGRAIPIAIEQAKEWHDNANKEEISQILQINDQQLRERSDDQVSGGRPELLDNGEHVVAHENGWAVKVEDAIQPSDVFQNKQDAVKRAKEIAQNKGTEAIIHKEDGRIHDFTSYDNQ